MDLAKIRQKARQGQEKAAPPESSKPSGGVVQRQDDDEPKPVVNVQPRPAPIEDDLSIVADTPRRTIPPPAIQPHHRVTPFDPIEAILAGRHAAGCDEDLYLSSPEQSQAVVEDYEEFLCIRVSDEIYGINIMQIKEIIKPREVTEVPRAPSFVSGIISLRGVIIPILDMLDRLGLRRESVTGKERVVVVKHGESFTGLLVDEVIQVVRISRTSFESAPAVLEGIDREFVTGIGRSDNRMVILLNLDTIADINLF
jgi:purine-binding chemotaxis protein CheW